MTSQTKAFGCMTSNIANAICIKQATQTVDQATKTLEQQCSFQAEMAKEMGGLGKDANKGLIILQLNEAVNSAESTKNAIQQEAWGAIASGCVNIGGVLAGAANFKFRGKDEGLENSIKNAEDLKTELNSPNDLPGSTNPEQSVEIVNDENINNRIAKWQGNDLREADFSDYPAVHEESVNKAAIRRIKEDPRLKSQIEHSLDQHINSLKLRKSELAAKVQNNLEMVISQVTTAGANGAQSAFKLKQADDQAVAQKEQAEAQVLQTVQQTVSAQAEASKQAASTYMSEMANILQNIPA